MDRVLDAFYALPDHAGSALAGYFSRLADAGVDVVESPLRSGHFELRR